jgi:hypothetical protein
MKASGGQKPVSVNVLLRAKVAPLYLPSAVRPPKVVPSVKIDLLAYLAVLALAPDNLALQKVNR